MGDSRPQGTASSGALIDLIGGTPLLEVTKVAGAPPGTRVFAKAEYLNPSGSVKDRAARAMVLDGLQTGRLGPGKTLLDATSGNTGIAYAMIGAALGFPVSLCMPSNASPERKQLLRAFQAHLIETDPLAGSDGALVAARALVNQDPERYFYPDQYNNPVNWQAHYHATAPEIWDQTQGTVTHFVAGMGTSGTFMGTSRRLKELNPSLEAVAMQPDFPLHGLEGMKHMASTVVPGIYDASRIDRTVEVATEDAQAMVLRLARELGIFVGTSSGGNVVAAGETARQAAPGSVIVTILCDSGFRYLSDPLWRQP